MYFLPLLPHFKDLFVTAKYIAQVPWLSLVKYRVSRCNWSVRSLKSNSHSQQPDLPYPSCGLDESKVVYEIRRRKEQAQCLHLAFIRDVAVRENISKSHIGQWLPAPTSASWIYFWPPDFWNDSFRFNVVWNTFVEKHELKKVTDKWSLMVGTGKGDKNASIWSVCVFSDSSDFK